VDEGTRNVAATINHAFEPPGAQRQLHFPTGDNYTSPS